MDRFALDLPARITVTDENGKSRAIKTTTKNICAGGAFILTEQILTVGTEVKMDLILTLDKLPQMEGRGSRIDVSGSVIRTESQGIAVRFDKKYKISPVDL